MKSRTIVFIGLCLLGSIGNVVGLQQRANNKLYWLSFTLFFNNAPNHSGTRFLMQIDSLGQVIIKPKVVVTPSKFESSTTPTAISNGRTGTLNLWMTDKNGTIFRAEIEKQTLYFQKLINTRLTTTNEYSLALTKKNANNFVLVEKNSGRFPFYDLLSWAISPIGLNKGKSSMIRSGAFDHMECGNACGEAVSSDGKTVIWDKGGTDYHPQLTIQELDSSGRYTGRSIYIGNWHGNGEPVSFRADATNVLAPGNIFVVYKNNGFESLTTKSELFLRILHVESFTFVGDKIPLFTIEGSFAQFGDVVIDPQGHFVMFSAKSESQALFFLALDATGHPSGEPKVILKNAFPSGVDILEASEQ